MAVGICIVLGLSSDPLSSQGILGGDGDNRVDMSNWSYRKQPLLL